MDKDQGSTATTFLFLLSLNTLVRWGQLQPAWPLPASSATAVAPFFFQAVFVACCLRGIQASDALVVALSARILNQLSMHADGRQELLASRSLPVLGRTRLAAPASVSADVSACIARLIA